MSEDKKTKWQKVGAVLKGAKNNYLVLGNTKAQDNKYNYNVELTVTDMDGKVIVKTKNGLVSAFNPRTSQYASQNNIPENLIAELFVPKGE